MTEHKLLFDNQPSTISFEGKNTLPNDIACRKKTQEHQATDLLNFEYEYKSSEDF